jgi:hypothetical protein
MWRSFDGSTIVKQLYPDQETYKKEEQRRFEILDAHWICPSRTWSWMRGDAGDRCSGLIVAQGRTRDGKAPPSKTEGGTPKLRLTIHRSGQLSTLSRRHCPSVMRIHNVLLHFSHGVKFTPA